jgi:hypothetical protein
VTRIYYIYMSYVVTLNTSLITAARLPRGITGTTDTKN